MRSAVCLNCEQALVDRFCSRCGQRDDGGHRSLNHLLAESVEAFTHADDRLLRTIRLLLLRPGQLTRDYLRGRRAAQIPPLRLFLVAMLLLFGVGALLPDHLEVGTLAPADHRAAQAAIEALSIPKLPFLQRWLRLHLLLALDRPQRVLDTMRDWAERAAVLMPPAAAVMLWALFALARRPEGGRFSLFDHLVFSLHSLSAASLVLAADSVLKRATGFNADLLLLVLPVHLFNHMRGTYGSGRIGTLLRMAALFCGSVLTAVVLLAGLAALGLQLGTRGG